MPGLAEVAAGQGSGLSWMAPASTFDPITYAKDAINVRMQQQQLGQQRQTATAKMTDFKPGKMMNIDRTTKMTRSISGLQQYATELYQKDPDNQHAYENQLLLTARANEVQATSDIFEREAEEFDAVNKLIVADKGKELSTDDMKMNLGFYEDPEHFIGTPEFADYQASWDGIKTEMAATPYYQTAAGKLDLEDDARIAFREANKNELLGTILKPESLIKDWVSKKDFLVNTIKTVTEKGGVVKTDERSTLDGQTVKFTDGTEQYIPGTKETAAGNYDMDDNISRSAKQYFKKLSPTVKANYTGVDPAKDWYIDEMTLGGRDVTTSQTLVKGKGGGSSFSFGGYKVQSDLSFNAAEMPLWVSRANELGGNTSTRVIEIKDGKKEISVDNVDPQYIYDSKTNTQIKSLIGHTITLKGATPFKAPVFSKDITTVQLVKAIRDGGFMDKFEKEFKDLYGKFIGGGSLEGVILRDKEVGFFTSIGFGEWIKDEKFVRGVAQYKDTDGKLISINGAIVPIVYAAPTINQLIGEGYDINLMLDGEFPDKDYRLLNKRQEKKKDPVKTETEGTSLD